MRVSFGSFEVDLDSGEVHRGGTLRTRLQEQPLRVLELLVARPGELVSRETIRQRMWPDNVHTDHDQGIAKAVLKLRTALGDSAESPRFIETLPRRGYRFVADVRRAGPEAPRPGDAAGEHGRRPRPRTLGVAAALAVGLLTLLLVRHVRSPVEADDEAISVAVLPFRPLDATPDEISLGLGMADTLITKLSAVSRLSVRPTSAVMHAFERDESALEIGRRLGVDHVLEGTYQRRNGDVRVSVRLLRAADGQPLWAEVLDAKMENLFDLQDEISERVVGGLSLRLSPEEGLGLARRHTASLEAYEEYLRGLYFFEQRGEESLRAAVASFQQAIDLDPDFALAYAGLADAYGPLLYFAHMSSEDGNARLKAAAYRALELDDSLAEVHTAVALAHSFEWDFEAEERSYRRALALNPNYALAHQWYGFLLGVLGRYEESLEERRRAWELDPTRIVHCVSLADALFRAGHVDEATAQLEKTLALDPRSPVVLGYAGHLHAQRGELEPALEYFERAGRPVARAGTLARAGRTVEADELFAELIREGRLSAYQRASIHASRGEAEEAFEWLEEAYRERTNELTRLSVDWLFEPLYPDPRFAEMLRRIGLRKGA